jgi:hypothetical protein
MQTEESIIQDERITLEASMANKGLTQFIEAEIRKCFESR